jgi:putative membrane protein
VVVLGASCSKTEKSTEETQATNQPAPADQTNPPMNAAGAVRRRDRRDRRGSQRRRHRERTMAQTKSGNSDVKSFGRMMVTDHTSVNDKAKALATQLNLTPQESDASRQMKAMQDSLRSTLQGKSGAEFDKAYVNNEVELHQMVLNELDQNLIPNAQNAQLKQLLTDTRPAIAEHLQHARDLQQRLGGHGESLSDR